tara:strand:+ start:886 stop:1059 length:174 start_codon:yes stop_codon:yes gene_type:complete
MRFLFNLLIILLLSVMISCEDDPLLAPSEPKEDKGSYAKLSLPGSERTNQRDNPEIY